MNVNVRNKGEDWGSRKVHVQCKKNSNIQRENKRYRRHIVNEEGKITHTLTHTHTSLI